MEEEEEEASNRMELDPFSLGLFLLRYFDKLCSIFLKSDGSLAIRGEKVFREEGY